MFQYTPLEIIGTAVTRIMPERYRQAHRSPMDRLGKAGGSYSVDRTLEIEGMRKDGTIFPLELSLSNCTTEDGTYFTGILRNITERKQAERDLRESEEYCRALFEKSPIGLALCRLNGELVDCNAAYASIVGRRPEEMAQLSYWDLTPEEYTDEEQKQLESLRTTGRYGPYEKEYIRMVSVSRCD